MPKLVRDLIPAIMKESNKMATFHIAGDEEYAERLMAKLNEEIEEYRENPCLEELSDVLEVLYAIANKDGHTLEELEATRRKKVRERGGFKDRIVMS